MCGMAIGREGKEWDEIERWWCGERVDGGERGHWNGGKER